jgi:hypothetical protein
VSPRSTSGVRCSSWFKVGYAYLVTTIVEYAAQQFPSHKIDMWIDDGESNPSLVEHTVVAHVVGVDDGRRLITAVKDGGSNIVVAALVRPPDSSDNSAEHVDRDGIVDVSTRRIGLTALTGALGVGAIASVVTLVITRSAMTSVIIGVFSAILGAVVGATVGGGARFGGERTSQPRAKGEDIAVIAALCPSETEAAGVVSIMRQLQPHTLRLVDAAGSWHAPQTIEVDTTNEQNLRAP